MCGLLGLDAVHGAECCLITFLRESIISTVLPFSKGRTVVEKGQKVSGNLSDA